MLIRRKLFVCLLILKCEKRVDHTNSILKPQASVDWDQKFTVLLCRFLPMFLSIVFSTNVPNVLPSRQCIKRCTAKDNADVTDKGQQVVASCKNIEKTFVDWKLQDFWLLLTGKDKTGFSLQTFKSDYETSMINPFIKLKLVS